MTSHSEKPSKEQLDIERLRLCARGAPAAELLVIVERLQTQKENLLTSLAAKQAKIDALMLEFYPGEMSAQQRAEWADSQSVAPDTVRTHSFWSPDRLLLMTVFVTGDSIQVADDNGDIYEAAGKEVSYRSPAHAEAGKQP